MGERLFERLFKSKTLDVTINNRAAGPGGKMTADKNLKELVDKALLGDDEDKKNEVISLLLKTMFQDRTHPFIQIQVGRDNQQYTYYDVPGEVLSFCMDLLEEYKAPDEDEDNAD